MFIDLTAAVPLLVPTICPFSLVVRTMGRTNSPLEGRLQRKVDKPGRTEEVPPSAQKAHGGFTLYETFVPLDSGRTTRCILCYGKGCRNCDEMVARTTTDSLVQPAWEVATLAQIATTGEYGLWRPTLSVLRQKDPKVYMVTLGDSTKDRATLSILYKIDTLTPLTPDRAPLQDARKPPTADAYGQILGDE